MAKIRISGKSIDKTQKTYFGQKIIAKSHFRDYCAETAQPPTTEIKPKFIAIVRS